MVGTVDNPNNNRRVSSKKPRLMARNDGKDMADAVHRIMNGGILGSKTHIQDDSGHGEKCRSLEIEDQSLRHPGRFGLAQRVWYGARLIHDE